MELVPADFLYPCHMYQQQSSYWKWSGQVTITVARVTVNSNVFISLMVTVAAQSASLNKETKWDNELKNLAAAAVVVAFVNLREPCRLYMSKILNRF